MIRDLAHVVAREKARMGITLAKLSPRSSASKTATDREIHIFAALWCVAYTRPPI
jgi:hypothetical protein